MLGIPTKDAFKPSARIALAPQAMRMAFLPAVGWSRLKEREEHLPSMKLLRLRLKQRKECLPSVE